MAVFILVSGMFTGPHVWEETAAQLTSAGAEVHTVPLTGLDRGTTVVSHRPAPTSEPTSRTCSR